MPIANMPTREALEWCDRNMHNNYPLASDASGLAVSGVQLPQSFLVDMQLIVPYMQEQDNVDPRTRFFISSIERVGDGFQLSISYYRGPGATPVLCGKSGIIPFSCRHTDTVDSRTVGVYPVKSQELSESVLAPLTGLTGQFIVGTCIDMMQMGTLTFSYQASRLFALRVYMYADGMNRISFQASDGVEYTMEQDFAIRAGDGIAFAVTTGINPDTGGTMSVLTIRRVQTQEEAASPYQTAGDVVMFVNQSNGNAVKTINNVAPDARGNIVIRGSDCVGVTEMTNGLVVSNPCAVPCCESGATESMSTNINNLQTAQSRLEAYYDAIMSNINAIQSRLASLIMSRKSSQTQVSE